MLDFTARDQAVTILLTRSYEAQLKWVCTGCLSMLDFQIHFLQGSELQGQEKQHSEICIYIDSNKYSIIHNNIVYHVRPIAQQTKEI